ncbi:MAG: DUF333 domain-containing protein [Marinibacterium sp.]|nr:DUF333 domain-containing protein [Marinibacterium sp.]
MNMTPRKGASATLVLATLALAACDSTGQPQLANPAAKFCVSEGGRYEIVDSQSGALGYCVLPDGARVNAWDYFRDQTTG